MVFCVFFFCIFAFWSVLLRVVSEFLFSCFMELLFCDVNWSLICARLICLGKLRFITTCTYCLGMGQFFRMYYVSEFP